MKSLLLATLLLWGAVAARAVEFEQPVRVEAGGAAIRVESPGYAAPCWADFDGDGKKDLLVGQFNGGKIRVFKNLGDGYSEVMAKYPGIQIVAKHDGPLTRERGVKQTEDALVANPDLAAVYAANDDVALGAMQAVNAANRKGKTLVTGMNGVPPALRAVKEQNLAMTVELNPVLWGRLGVDVLATFLKGDKVEPRVFIKHIIIDSSNVDSKLPKT